MRSCQEGMKAPASKATTVPTEIDKKSPLPQGSAKSKE
jgi:hypothetical protein